MLNQSIKTKDGDFGAYLAKPKSGKGPGIVVIQEIYGVNANIRAIVDGLAAEGYFALAPDLFWRIEPNIQLDGGIEAEKKKAFDLFGKFKIDPGVRDIQAAIAHLREVQGCTGKIGAVGYCLGGLLAYLSGTRADCDSAVGYYGVNIQNFLGEANAIKKPLMLHVAAKDQFVPPAAQAQIAEGLKGNAHVTIHTYAGQEHAFARVGGEHFDQASADLANRRTAEFFTRTLG